MYWTAACFLRPFEASSAASSLRASRSRTFRRRIDAENFQTSTAGAILEGAYVDRAAGAVTLREFGEEWIKTRRGRDGARLRARTRALY